MFRLGALEIWQILKQRKLTQTELAKILGATQADVSRLKKGEFSRFSLARLLRFLKALGRDIEIHIRAQTEPREATRVIAA